MMYAWVKFSPMKSLRSPMIQKEKMMQKMRLADRKTLRDLRCDFFNAFLIMRNQMIRNQTQKMEEKEEVKKSNVQTKLN